MKKKWGKIFASPVWFFFGSLIFAVGGLRYILSNDNTGAVIYLSAALFFLIGFIGQILLNKKK